METTFKQIKIKGKTVKVPSILIDDKLVVVRGKYIKIASIFDEEWIENQIGDMPNLFITKLKNSNLKADIFTFSQKIPNIKPRFKYHVKWDNTAAIPITRFEDWWNYISTDMRKDLKRAEKREVITKILNFNDEIIKGVIEINNDSPIRQGVYFSHYGKDFDTIKKEYSTYLEKSEFIGAYYKNELIGLIKIVYVGELACMMQILSKPSHYDKRPTNAMIAKAVEVCEKKGKTYLTYGKYYYGNKKKSSLVDFKHRNGFECIMYPKYYIPLNLKGRIIIKLKLHLSLLEMLPGGLISFMVSLRSKFYQKIQIKLQPSKRFIVHSQNEKQAQN